MAPKQRASPNSSFSSNSVESLTAGLESLTTVSDGDSANSKPLLSSDPFDSEESRRLFDAIDDLRECGAGQHLDIPQVRLLFLHEMRALIFFI